MYRDFFDPAVTWSDFVMLAVVVGCIYTALVVLRQRLNRGLYLRDADGPVRATLRIILLLIDPLAIIILMAVFVAIWPAVHGMVVLLLLMFGFSHVKAFIAGRILRFDRSVQVGRQIRTKDQRGTVASFGLTSLYLQQEEGRSRIGYLDLLDKGYVVSGDPNRGGFFKLQVSLHELDSNFDAGSSDKSSAQHLKSDGKALDQLRHMLNDNPYVQPGLQLRMLHAEDNERVVDVNVGVHRAEHLRHLIAQLQEQGHGVTIESH